MRYNYKEYLEYVKNNKVKKEDLLTNINFFQHERLIHLLVTIFVGIVTILFLGIGISNELISFLIIGLITLVLFIFYIFHYYFLENSTQKLYKIYNDLKKKD